MSIKPVVLLGLGAVVVAGGIGAYSLMTFKKDGVPSVASNLLNSASESMGSKDTKNAGDIFSQPMSFVELMKLGENYTCTFSDTSEGTAVSGTVYVAGKDNKFRTDYVTTVAASEVTGNGASAESRTQTGSMISDGEYSYIWDSASDQGIKMKFDPTDEETMKEYESYGKEAAKNMPKSESDDTTPFDQNQDMKYDCNRWNVDASKFTPPTDVVFMDFSEQMTQFEDMMKSYDLGE